MNYMLNYLRWNNIRSCYMPLSHIILDMKGHHYKYVFLVIKEILNGAVWDHQLIECARLVMRCIVVNAVKILQFVFMMKEVIFIDVPVMCNIIHGSKNYIQLYVIFINKLYLYLYFIKNIFLRFQLGFKRLRTYFYMYYDLIIIMITMRSIYCGGL